MSLNVELLKNRRTQFRLDEIWKEDKRYLKNYVKLVPPFYKFLDFMRRWMREDHIDGVPLYSM